MENEILRPGDHESQEDIIDVEVYTRDGKKIPIGKKYKVRIGSHYYTFDHHLVTGLQLLQKAGISPVECYWLYQKFRDCDFEKIDLKETVDLTKHGIEHFVVKPTEVFHYFVDADPETTDEKELTPNQILEAAGLTQVSDYYLVKVNHDGSQTSLKDVAEVPQKMVCPAVKFISAFRGETGVS